MSVWSRLKYLIASDGGILVGGLRRTLRVFERGEIISRRVALYLSHRFSGLPLGRLAGFLGENPIGREPEYEEDGRKLVNRG